MTVIVEKRLLFEFGPSWQHVQKYDEQPVHVRGLQRMKGTIVCKNCEENARCDRCKSELEIGTKAVDIVASHGDQVYLIEVKDFRGYRVENKKRLRDGDLAFEVARKVRDTVAGLVGALHTGDAAAWRPLVTHIFKKAPTVVLWLEEDISQKRIRERGHPAMPVAERLRAYLRWLTTDVRIVNQQQGGPVGLRVRNIPRRVHDVRSIVNKGKPKGISRTDFCTAWATTPQIAGMALDRLCKAGILVQATVGSDWFTIGPAWENFYEDPEGTRV